MQRDISIDLETLSTRPDAAILSIGASAFNRNTGEIGRTMYVEVIVDDAIKHGHVDGSTVSWWMLQSAEARDLFERRNKVSLATALRLLTEFVQHEAQVGAPVPWGNGSTFDITILESAFNKVGMPIPWKFWHVRDMRTLLDAANEVGFARDAIAFAGTPHHAMHDAVHQAKVIAAAWQHVARQQAPDMDTIARVAHEINRAYCQGIGDHSQPAWEDAPEWQRASARMGVDLHLMGDFGPEASHISWMNQKLEDGWKYGPVKNPETKEHPCLVPFSDLPREQQVKDYLFRAVVHAMRQPK